MRVFTLFLLQVVLAGATPLANAHLEAEAAQADIHLESEAAPCSLGHDHLFCSFRRAFDAKATPSLPSPALSGPYTAETPRVTWRGEPRAGAIEATTRSPRAPPSA